uniref:Uncharacterized protein n=1 Tax=Medicago truncatula TaxID=3880 RepID=Q2HTH9_MEDTR|nr:hypothetical protein MtrDRAFT_AC150441g10v1 [Medicago truncatula]
MYEFLDTPQQNIIQPPPYTSPRNAYEPHYQSTYQQNSMTNYGYNDSNQASTFNNNYFSYNDQTKLHRPTPIIPPQQPTIPNVHQPKLQPPTNTNKPA